MIKCKSSYLLVVVVFLLTAMFGCGAGTNNGTNNGVTPNPGVSEVHGLSKVDDSGHLNAVLQMIINHPQLRSEVANNNPTAPFGNLFSAYDRHDSTALTFIHKQIFNYISSLPGMLSLGTSGLPLKVLQGDNDYSYSYGGLGMAGSISVVNPATWGGYNPSYNIILAFDDNVYNYTTLTYADIPEQHKIKGFIYNTGGHYVAYVKGGSGSWYMIDDNNISVVDINSLQRLPLGATPGIEIIILN